MYLTGDENDYLSLAIKDGAVSLSINIGNGRLDTGIRNRVIRFDDDVWHNVIITRVAEQVMNTTRIHFCIGGGKLPPLIITFVLDTD